MKSALETLSRRVDRIVRALASLGLVIMLCLVMAQIVTRYVLNDPPAWIDEAARTIMVWTALLGATAALRAGLDPKVMDRVTTGHGWRDTVIGWGRVTAIGLFAAAVLVASPGFVMRHFERTTDALEWNSACVVVIVPLFALILLIHLAAQMGASADNPSVSPPEESGEP